MKTETKPYREACAPRDLAEEKLNVAAGTMSLDELARALSIRDNDPEWARSVREVIAVKKGHVHANYSKVYRQGVEQPGRSCFEDKEAA